ncbi:hypothetical protein LOK49_LG01G00548 [Camellia lanceoleosa]|uniref:Uncharacterized protein n=1 Tax=Camellia lanceoleosa TaxID=1840588 RepID=A0ACC0IYM5_9ERIC|nr:hypothetical protein LOK49_LG01G00548 [Camellia lanceoleosa]
MNDVHHRVRNQSLSQKHNLIRNRVLCIFRFQIIFVIIFIIISIFRFCIRFIIISIFRFCIRSYVVHPLAIRSSRSKDHNKWVRRPQQSWYQQP